MNYYSHHIGDYRRETMHLSLLEHGIYRQLLDQYCLSEVPLPSDLEKIMRSVCVRNADEVRSLENVLADFFILEDSGYVHKSCEKTLIEYKQKSKKAADSANARWNKTEDANALNKDANAMRTQCEGNANHKPITNNHKPVLKTKAAPLNFYEADAQVVADFIKQRKTKPTQTAIEAIKSKAEGAGYTLEAALKICCERGWQGFNPDWVKGNSFAKPSAHAGFEKTNYMEGVAADGSF